MISCKPVRQLTAATGPLISRERREKIVIGAQRLKQKVRRSRERRTFRSTAAATLRDYIESDQLSSGDDEFLRQQLHLIDSR